MTCRLSHIPPSAKVIDLAAEAKRRGKELRYRMRLIDAPDISEAVAQKALDDVYHYVVGDKPEDVA